MPNNGSNGVVRAVADHIDVLPSAVRRNGSTLIVVSAGKVRYRVPAWELKVYARRNGRQDLVARIPRLDRIGSVTVQEWVRFSAGGMPGLA